MMKRNKNKATFNILILFLSFFVFECTNPFAPKIADYSAETPVLGDQTTIEGLFKSFSYAYKMKDTVVYGHLLDENFTFIYRNYDKDPPVDESWGRDIDMITTHRLFQGTQRIDLVWNEISSIRKDSLTIVLSRGFTLDVVIYPNDKFELQGKANFTLKRIGEGQPWRIFHWRDESNN